MKTLHIYRTHRYQSAGSSRNTPQQTLSRKREEKQKHKISVRKLGSSNPQKGAQVGNREPKIGGKRRIARAREQADDDDDAQSVCLCWCRLAQIKTSHVHRTLVDTVPT